MGKLKKILTTVLVTGFVLALFSPYSEAFKDLKSVEFMGNHNVPGGQPMQLGTQITSKKIQVLRCNYSFAVQGGTGSSSNIKLKDTDGSDCQLPPGAIIIDGVIDGLFIPAGSASIAISSNAYGAAQGDIKAPLAASSYSGLVDVIPAQTAATMIKHSPSTVPAVPSMRLNGTLTSGKFNVFLEYYLSQ